MNSLSLADSVECCSYWLRVAPISLRGRTQSLLSLCFLKSHALLTVTDLPTHQLCQLNQGRLLVFVRFNYFHNRCQVVCGFGYQRRCFSSDFQCGYLNRSVQYFYFGIFFQIVVKPKSQSRVLVTVLFQLKKSTVIEAKRKFQNSRKWHLDEIVTPCGHTAVKALVLGQINQMC